MIPFKQISANLRVPMFYAELDNSQANSSVTPQRTLLIGQVLAAGVAVPNVPIQSQGVGDAAVQGGYESMIHLMTNVYRQNDVSGELWYLPVADAGGAVKATGTFTFTAVPTVQGTLSLYVAGVLVQLNVTVGQSVASMATALAALINNAQLVPVTAAAAAGVVTITANNAGLNGNDIDIRVNYRGTAGGEVTPAGITYAIVAMANGATNPTLTTALANLANKTFDFIICPYTDSTSLIALASFLNDFTGRWSWAQMLYGHVFTALRGTSGALTTFGAGQNNQHQTVMGFNDSPSPNWYWASALAGAAAVSLRNDPGMPLQFLTLQGILAPPTQSQFSLTINNQLLYSGISTFNVLDDGTITLQNVITSYLENAQGNPDDSYLEVETMFTLMFVIRFMQQRIVTKFGRFKLADNGTRIKPGASVVTPNIIRADQITAFQTLGDTFGLVQNIGDFITLLDVERNPNNPNRVDVLWPGELISQLRVVAFLAQFRLSSASGN